MPHCALEIDIDQRHAFSRPRVSGQVHRSTGQLAMHPVRDKRRKGREQPACGGEYFVQGCESSPIVGLIYIVKTVAALADVPLRDVLVEEGHHCLRGVRSLELSKQLVRFALNTG